MLLYITVEDVLGAEEPERSGPRRLATPPRTLAGLYDHGLRHHERKAVMLWPDGHGFEPVPDWKFDRLAIRVALFCRERLGLEPGGRIAIVGPLSWLWPTVEFGAMGFGLVPVGLEHDLTDDVLTAALAEAAPGAVFATDAGSAERVRRLRQGGRLGGATVVAAGLPEEEGLLSVERLLELGAVLDTAERAQNFRAFSRQIAPESTALWHAESAGLHRLTHETAAAAAASLLQSRPAFAGDIAYLDSPRVTLRKRLALAAFVGDGWTTVALGRPGQGREDIAELRPHKVMGSLPWLSSLCVGRGPRWPAGLDRPWARRRLRRVLGERLRSVEADSSVALEAVRGLEAAGIRLETPGALTTGQC